MYNKRDRIQFFEVYPQEAYDSLFSKFAENYWNLVAKYHIRQMRYNGQSYVSKLELIIESVLAHSAAIGEIEFENLSVGDRETVISQVKRDCSRNVIGALYNDFNGCLYGFDKKEHRIWIHNGAYQFLLAYKIEIEQLNYYAWAKFLEDVNADDFTKQLISKLERSTPQRKNLSIYRDILRQEFESNTCYYCGCKLGNNPHVDHVLPWSFVKSDHLWNFVLSCPKCNIKKKNKLPSRHDLANVIIRNDELKLSTIPFVKTEMIGYHDDLMWNIWDYAHSQGYFVYNNAT